MHGTAVVWPPKKSRERYKAARELEYYRFLSLVKQIRDDIYTRRQPLQEVEARYRHRLPEHIDFRDVVFYRVHREIC